MLHDIVVTSLSRQHDMEVVDAAEAGAGLSRLPAAAGAEFLVLSAAGAELAPEQQRLMRERPRLRILAVDAEGREGVLYETVPGAGLRGRPLPEVSMELLEAAIRASAAAAGGGEREGAE